MKGEGVFLNKNIYLNHHEITSFLKFAKISMRAKILTFILVATKVLTVYK